MTSRDAAFIPGRLLAEKFYIAAVRPLLTEGFPDLPHAAALLGRGSDVLGYDTPRSMDHDWGPRLQIFVRTSDYAHRRAIVDYLADRLPNTFYGFPTNFAARTSTTRRLQPTTGPIHHGVEVLNLDTWLQDSLGFDPRHGVDIIDWLATPSQRLAEFTTGKVFHDGLADLTVARRALEWYPTDVWRYLLACQWTRIAREEGLGARCAEVDDELGAALITGRLIRDLMRLHLLMRRRYPPYSKWLGSAVREPADDDAMSAWASAMTGHSWKEREEQLNWAYRHAAEMHNSLDLTAPQDPAPRRFNDRPYTILVAGRFADALVDAMDNPEVRRLPLLGSIDQFTDCRDINTDLATARHVVRAALDL